MSRLIKQLSCFEVDEITGVDEYAKMAIECHTSGEKDRAKKFYSMAKSEHDHAVAIHEMLVEEISKERDRSKRLGISIPSLMMSRYEKKHSEYVEQMEIAESYLSIYESMIGA